MTNNPYEETINDILNNRLCDFQKATVDYLYKRMVIDGQKRMLVADEVGLGKTEVAKGLIAKAFQTWYNKEDRQDGDCFNVFYICSNQSLSSQNLRKLNFGSKDSIVADVDRLTLFALKPKETNSLFHLYSLTPDTSFNPKSSQGVKEERYIIYLLLKDDKEIDANKFSNFMNGEKKLGSWGNYWYKGEKIQESSLREELFKTYKTKVASKLFSFAEHKEIYDYLHVSHETSLWEVLKAVCLTFDRRSYPLGFLFRHVIGELKQLLIETCLKYIDANVFIMDEFQRYSRIIELVGLTDEEFAERGYSENDSIARSVFRYNDATVLMLSATPFKAFTNENDEIGGEAHFKEFMKVLKFLYQEGKVDWGELEKNRRSFYTAMLRLRNVPIERRKEYIKQISSYKQYLENVYSKVMVRTEKIIASNNPNGMTREMSSQPIKVTNDDIKDFVNLDQVFKCIYERSGEHAPVPMEYAKSSPFAMSFLRDYNVWKKASESQQKLEGIFRHWKKAFLDMSQINNYQFHGYGQADSKGYGKWPNGKLNIVMKDLDKNAMLLWCPPSLPYYPLMGVFKGRQNFSKTLIFSAWKIVPKMVSTLLSYEVERDTIGRYDVRARYFSNKNANISEDMEKYRRPRPQLVFRSGAKNMTTLLLAYPSEFLVRQLDPLKNLHFGYATSRERNIVRDLKDSFYHKINDFINNYNQNEYDRKSDSTALNWILPIKEDSQSGIGSNWIKKINLKRSDSSSNLNGHLNRLALLINDEEKVELPAKISSLEKRKIAENLAYLVLGSPAICAYRTLERYFPQTNKDTLLARSMEIGLSFINLFNKPESIAVVGLAYSNIQLDYWSKVIRYCADGCLQSVLDEYVFMLMNDYDTIDSITEIICSQLSMRTGTLIVDDRDTFCQQEDSLTVSKKRMRTHYAMPFGIQSKVESGVIRSSSVRSAFNSPFRPFVLTTTSIGQEGLDFHYYCRKVVHWNLPNNPIDLEQREGRINRFRGKVIRQRIAEKYWKQLSDSQNPWKELFEIAANEKEQARFSCDIVPNWHIEVGESNAWIEREVPMYEFSMDIEKYELMKKALGKYRLAFGQPRQEELIEAIDDNLSEDEKDMLLIDLAPIKKVNRNG